MLWASKHKHPFRKYTDVGLSFVVNKHAIIYMYALESAAAPVTRPRAEESRTDIYIIVCRCMLYILYTLPCVTPPVYGLCGFSISHISFQSLLHICTHHAGKKSEMCLSFIVKSTTEWLQQLTLWFPRRRLGSIDRDYLNYNITIIPLRKIFYCSFPQVESQIFLIVFLMLEKTVLAGDEFPDLHSSQRTAVLLCVLLCYMCNILVSVSEYE